MIDRSKNKLCHMPAACDDCPFRRDGGVRLRDGRIRDLAQNAAGAFPCHKTVNRAKRNRATEIECAGAIIFAYKTDTTTQMLRISERLGMVDPRLAGGGHPEIFDSLEEMLETADDKQERVRARSGR